MKSHGNYLSNVLHVTNVLAIFALGRLLTEIIFYYGVVCIYIQLICSCTADTTSHSDATMLSPVLTPQYVFYSHVFMRKLQGMLQ